MIERNCYKDFFDFCETTPFPGEHSYQFRETLVNILKIIYLPREELPKAITQVG